MDRKIEAVIFDWAGTTVDYGCFAPVQAFSEVFKEFGVTPTMEEVRKPMGMLKIDHIWTEFNNAGRKNTIVHQMKKMCRRCTQCMKQSY